MSHDGEIVSTTQDSGRQTEGMMRGASFGGEGACVAWVSTSCWQGAMRRWRGIGRLRRLESKMRGRGLGTADYVVRIARLMRSLSA